MNPRNPFQPAPGAPPPALIGRAPELAAIAEACVRAEDRSNPTPMVFVGLRGLGKTVLLKAVKERTPLAVHLDIEIEPNVPLATSVRFAIEELQSSVEPLYRRIAKATDTALRALPRPGFELPHDLGAITLNPPREAHPEHLPLGRSIGVLNDAAMKAKHPLIITIDEIQDVDVPGLRSLVARVHQTAGSPAPIMLACAGLPEAEAVFDKLRTYASRWNHFELVFLTPDETAQAIRLPIQEAGRTIEDAALDLLAAEAAGYPFFIQQYGSAAWNQHRGKNITLEDASAAVAAARPMIEKTFYAKRFAELAPREMQVCQALAALGPGPHRFGEVARRLGLRSSEIGSTRSNLLRKGIVFIPSPTKVQFRMPLADRYVRELDQRRS